MKNAVRENEVGNLNAAGIKIMHFERPINAHCFRTHWQDRIEFLLCKKGEMTIEYNDKVLVLKEGQTAIIPPHTVHRGYTTNSSVIYEAVMFDLRSFYNETPICKETLPLIFEGRLTFNAITENEQIFDCLGEICESENAAKTVSLVYYLLFLVLSSEVTMAKPMLNDGLKNMIKYIEENFREPLNNAILSKEFNYSPEHFCRKFKEGTGLSPMNYLKIYRLEYAYRMLKKGNANISSVAAKSGFDDANYFTRCFKKHFGIPPRNCTK